MKRLSLDFRRAPVASPAGYALLAAGLLCAGLAVAGHVGLNQELERYRDLAQAASGPGDRAGRSELPLRSKSEKEALDSARNVVEHLTVPWDRLFGALEGVQEKDVALLSITPNTQKRQVRVFAEAKNLAAMLSYHQKLEASPAFSEVALSEHEVQLQDPERPVRFNILATWSL